MFESKPAGYSSLLIAIAMACSLPAAAGFAEDASSAAAGERLAGLLRPEDATAKAPERRWAAEGNCSGRPSGAVATRMGGPGSWLLRTTTAWVVKAASVLPTPVANSGP